MASNGPRAGVRPRRLAAVGAGKLTALASRAMRLGGGTALPGAVATRLHPRLAAELAGQLHRGAILVSGTNGKTTTSRMLAGILADAGWTPVRNEAGSNLMRGVASSLVREAGLLGNLPQRNEAVGIFEVDEAALPQLAGALEPRALLLLDLFRDQLDRYGEVATIVRIWSEALLKLALTTGLVVNGDDPLLADTALSSPLSPTFFGIEGADRQASEPEHASDVKACPQCGGHVQYRVVFLGHLGHYACTSCAFARPRPTVSARDVHLHGLQGSSFQLARDGEAVEVRLPVAGLYNVYNALAAASLASWLGIALEQAAVSLARVTPAFGRMERLEIEGRTVYLVLAKNPAGLNEVMRTAAEDSTSLHLFVMLSDNTADGHDVSWIWDADIELLRGRVASVIFGGTRAPDMALRFKYGGVIAEGNDPTWEVAPTTEAGFRRALALTPQGSRLIVIPTYTALLDVRNTLTRLGHVRPYWE
jgi:lipid II isoglutaminyl synthase (glutamine-hydrolysing)